jgi:hypothetical protein
MKVHIEVDHTVVADLPLKTSMVTVRSSSLSIGVGNRDQTPRLAVTYDNFGVLP